MVRQDYWFINWPHYYWQKTWSTNNCWCLPFQGSNFDSNLKTVDWTYRQCSQLYWNKTFHSYCFDLLGRVGSLLESGNIINTTVEKIRSGRNWNIPDPKTILVVDEAQDMNKEEYELVKTLMEQNEEMQVILVGDDDPEYLYGFREPMQHMQPVDYRKAAVPNELTENYRAKTTSYPLWTIWASTISKRRKQNPALPASNKTALIEITQYANNNIIVPLADHISQAHYQDQPVCLPKPMKTPCCLLVCYCKRECHKIDSVKRRV